MKAVVLEKYGESPRYQEFPDPKPAASSEVVMEVMAAALKNLDKMMAAGKSYLNYGELPAVAGSDAVGVLADGTKVYARTKELLVCMNRSSDPEEIRSLLSEITGSDIDESVAVFTPLYINYGKHTRIGRNVFINFDCVFLDLGGITIEDNVLDCTQGEFAFRRTSCFSRRPTNPRSQTDLY